MGRISFNEPGLLGKELEYVRVAIGSKQLSGDGVFTGKCKALLEQSLGVECALLTPSCTAALELAALLLDIKPGDEVVVPSFTFVSTVNAFVLRGAKPVFVDIRYDTLNLDERLVEAAISRRTRVVVPVHYAGVGCEMNSLVSISEDHGIALVEDNAHGLFGQYQGQYLGTFGCMAAQSFHETKNFSCGEGGALLVNDLELVQRAEVLRDKGTDRKRFLRGEVDKYTWQDVGSSFLPSEIQAAYLFAQLEERRRIQEKRRKIWTYYARELRAWSDRHGVCIPTVPAACEQSFHLFFLILPSQTVRDAMLAHLNRNEVNAVFHYVPLHVSAMGRRFGWKEGDCPVTEDVSKRLLRLPFHVNLTDADLRRVVDEVMRFRFPAN